MSLPTSYSISSRTSSRSQSESHLPDTESPSAAPAAPGSPAAGSHHADALNGIVCTREAAFTPPPSLAEFDALVRSVATLPPGQFQETARRLARALGLGALPLLGSAEWKSLGSRLDAVEPGRCSAPELLALLDAAGQFPAVFTPSPESLGRWQAAFLRSLAPPEPVAAASGRCLADRVRASTAFAQLEGQPRALAAVLSYAFGGPANEHSPLYDELCRQLVVSPAGIDGGAQRVADVLIQAFLDSMQGLQANAAKVGEQLAQMRRLVQDGVFSVSTYRSEMSRVFANVAAPPSVDGAALAHGWVRLLDRWKTDPQSRDRMVDEPTGLLPQEAVDALVDAASRREGDLSDAVRQARLEGRKMELQQLFEHCLERAGIPPAERELLLPLVRGQFSEAASTATA